MDRPRRVALPWYRAEDYSFLRTGLADGAKLPERHGAWLLATEQVEQVVQRSGVEVVRVTIEPDDFLAWCKRVGLVSDGAARSRYAAEILETRETGAPRRL
ncbi:hypothetical protein [Methylorubrum sp. SL192]|uniref:hypothetical protein n=1 Tax=Methylorubrum sp. SL192 TaxID=2995167 RepID=UPI002274EFCF|nr:hypothetical protein [Methylorubrum sp. SL192]MCY1642125.1 hypothetical protein [Methylorubrum sp. SL192]